LLSALAVVFVVAVLIPPIGNGARRYDWVEALQFAILALVAPALFAAGAPWHQIRLSRAATTLAEARRRHPERLRSAAIVCVALSIDVAWRTPAAVNRLHAGGWPLALEVVSLTACGLGLWLECTPSPPLLPRSTRPVRIALAAVGMWTIWILAYVVAMSSTNWYSAYHHPATGGLSLAGDQQIAAGVMWALAGVCFVPLIFWNLLQWLRSEENPDEELHRLVREEHRRAVTPRRFDTSS
jgi:cytochrome c oxidase assembly factor CtaG